MGQWDAICASELLPQQRLVRYVDGYGPGLLKVAHSVTASVGSHRASVVEVQHVPTAFHDQPPVDELILHFILDPGGTIVSTRINDLHRVVRPQPGSILITMPDRPSLWSWSGTPRCRNIGLPLDLLRSLTDLDPAALTDRLGSLCSDQFYDPDLTRLGETLARIAHGTDRGDAALLADDILLQIAANILNRIDLGNAGQPERRSARLPVWKINRIVDYIQGNLASPLRLNDLAQLAGLSDFHFCRAFRAATGQTPYQRILSERLVSAQQLLTKSNLPVSEVARVVGFTSQAHFTTAFRKHTGEPPARFRRTRQTQSRAG